MRIPGLTTNTHVGFVTSFHLLTGQKSFLPRYRFGQVGLFYSPGDEADLNSEWGICIGCDRTSNYLRAN